MMIYSTAQLVIALPAVSSNLQNMNEHSHTLMLNGKQEHIQVSKRTNAKRQRLGNKASKSDMAHTPSLQNIKEKITQNPEISSLF